MGVDNGAYEYFDRRPLSKKESDAEFFREVGAAVSSQMQIRIKQPCEMTWREWLTWQRRRVFPFS